jgi:hypothetical protein
MRALTGSDGRSRSARPQQSSKAHRALPLARLRLVLQCGMPQARRSQLRARTPCRDARASHLAAQALRAGSMHAARVARGGALRATLHLLHREHGTIPSHAVFALWQLTHAVFFGLTSAAQHLREHGRGAWSFGPDKRGRCLSTKWRVF